MWSNGNNADKHLVYSATHGMFDKPLTYYPQQIFEALPTANPVFLSEYEETRSNFQEIHFTGQDQASFSITANIPPEPFDFVLWLKHNVILMGTSLHCASRNPKAIPTFCDRFSFQFAFRCFPLFKPTPLLSSLFSPPYHPLIGTTRYRRPEPKESSSQYHCLCDQQPWYLYL